MGTVVTAFVLLLLFMPDKVSAETQASEYTIEAYHISMIVNEDNTFDITERIEAYFNVPKHGIYRKIPLKNSVIRRDGTRSNNKAQISNIEISENYILSEEGDYKYIKIGDENSTLTGTHTYIIKYKYNIGKDPLENEDELYFNLIGNQWDTSISNITFLITMPKSFDEKLLGFSSGSVGSNDSSHITYSVDGNQISGKVTNTLNAGQALTVRLTLPEGYFVGAGFSDDIYPIIAIILCIVFVMIAGGLWAKYGKDDEVVESIEFYPPKGYNSAEIGFLYEGVIRKKSIISLLIYLANEGYLEITKVEEKGLFGKSKNFRITKLKEYYGNNKYERRFFKGLFKYKNTVTACDLYDNFNTTLDEIKVMMNSKENKNKIFEVSSKEKIKWLILMNIVICFVITAIPITAYYGEEAGIFTLVAVLFTETGFNVLIESIINCFIGSVRDSKIKTIVIGVVFGGIFGGIPLVYMVIPALMQEPMFIVMYTIGIISMAVLRVFTKIMPKRTPYGNEMLGKIRGFKRFLETAEKPRLEALVSENPQYFYDILPYTYVLGVSDVWMSRFEIIALQAPDWYEGDDLEDDNSFDLHKFNQFINHTMKVADNVISSGSSSDSGDSSSGDSSGGGISGGGSGGGGGGSW